LKIKIIFENQTKEFEYHKEETMESLVKYVAKILNLEHHLPDSIRLREQTWNELPENLTPENF